MYINFTLDGFVTTSRRCSEKTAADVLATLCRDWGVQSSSDGKLYMVVAGHGCTSEVGGNWSLTKDRAHQNWDYRDAAAAEHRAARAALTTKRGN